MAQFFKYNKQVTIDAVPVTLFGSNTVYLFADNLTLKDIGPAIAVVPGVTNILIDLQHFELVLPSEQLGILIEGRLDNPTHGIKIVNGTIRSDNHDILQVTDFVKDVSLKNIIRGGLEEDL